VKILQLYILFFVFVCSSVQAQNDDSLKIKIRKDSIHAKHVVKKAIYSSARKASIMSACLPGLGQIFLL